MIKTYPLGSLNLARGTLQDITRTVVTAIENRQSMIVVPCSLNDMASIWKDPQVLPYYQHVDICAADGMPLVWWLRRKTHGVVDRIYGPTLMKHVLTQLKNSNVRHAFFGTTPIVLKKLDDAIRRIAPQTTVVSLIAPPYTSNIDRLYALGLSRIRRSKPTVLWIGVSSPKQVVLAARLKRIFPHCVILCVGAAFDIVAGVKPQAPTWIQNTGLEWLFRLLIEPRRLYKRYIVDIPLFFLATVLSVCISRARRLISFSIHT